jgi:GDP-fucose transporter C1
MQFALKEYQLEGLFSSPSLFHYHIVSSPSTMSEAKDDKILPLPALHRPVQHPMSLIIAAIAFYWVASLSVVFLNKTILSGSEYRFPYPLFVTLFQLVVALVLLLISGHLGKR